ESPEFEASTSEPIVLPGESLSKYRKPGDDPIAAAPASRPTAPNITIPSTPGYTIPAAWDGGATLPGESLSPHRPPQNRPEAHSDYNTTEPNAVIPSGTVEDQTEAIPVVTSDPFFSTELPHETVGPAAPVEYEPTDASASYRVDPAAPSEFRQSAPVLD